MGLPGLPLLPGDELLPQLALGGYSNALRHLPPTGTLAQHHHHLHLPATLLLVLILVGR